MVGNEAKHQIANWLPLLDEAQASPQIVHNKIRRLPFSLPLPLAEEAKQSNYKVRHVVNSGAGRLRLHVLFCIIHSLAEGHDIEFNNLCAEAEQQVAAGIQEIVLTGVNLGTYDLHGQNL